MLALYLRGQSEESAAQLEIADKDIVAIIEEYQSNEATRLEVSLKDISAAVPVVEEPAWQQFAMAPKATNFPKIIIIIDDLGLDEEASSALAALPGPYTLAFLPYADNLENQTKGARKAGHELLVHLPMQSHRKTADPGKNALLKGLSFEEFGQRLEWNLSRFSGFVGINNHMGSMLTEDPALMVRLMARLRHDGLLFVDSLTTPNSVGERAARVIDVPFLARDVFLDNERNAEYINRQLATTERIASLRGYAIAIGHPYAETLTALKDWQETLEFKGFQLAPLSQVMAEQLAIETRNAAKN